MCDSNNPQQKAYLTRHISTAVSYGERTCDVVETTPPRSLKRNIAIQNELSSFQNIQRSNTLVRAPSCTYTNCSWLLLDCLW